MDEFEQIQQAKQLAPAYIIFGPIEQSFLEIKNSIQTRTGSMAHPDVQCAMYDTFGVDEARAAASFSFFKPLGDTKYIAIACHAMTAEAQHALLKLVEEGKGSSVFFFMLPYGAHVLPTLVSRSTVLRVPGNTEVSGSDDALAFLRMNYQERLHVVEKIAKEQDREAARGLVRALLALSKEKPYTPQLLRDLLEADRFLQLSGSSPKSVLGHLALVL